MSRVIDINWAGLSQVGNSFLDQSNEVNNICDKINKTISELHECWNGVDCDNFITNSKTLIYSLKKEKTYIEEWSLFLTKTSQKYGDNFEEALSRIKKLENEFDFEEV